MALAAFAPAMVNRLMDRTGRILGELSATVTDRIAHSNAVRRYRLQ